MAVPYRCSSGAALLAALTFACCTHAWGQAEEKQQVAPTYPIAEPDMLAEIDSKLRRMQQSGELGAKIDQAIKQSTHTAQYPKPVAGLGRVKTSRTFFIDPSIAADRDVRDQDGKVVVANGAKVNPLDYVSLSEWLIFFDGTDPRQVEIAESLAKKYDWAVKPILTNGGPMDLMRKWKKRVFFDQGGALVKRLQITSTPAVVSQQGKLLRIDELAY